MFKSLVCLAIFIAASPVAARYNILERDDRAVFLAKRRFGQEQPAALEKIRNACPGQVCGTLAGQAVSTLLAASPECAQQDLADEIITQSKQFDAATQAAMVAAAIEFRQAEKNTPPDFTTQPPTLRNSVFCQKAPLNAELNGLVQAQDPANDPNIFFDPATKSSVQLGTQANTAPFGGAAAVVAPAASPVLAVPAVDNVATPAGCPAPAVVTVTVPAPANGAPPPPPALGAPPPPPANGAPPPPPANVAPPPPANVDNGAAGANLQAFAGALGGVVAPTVINLGQGDRPFQVTGNAAFNNLQSALVRSCDVQNNQCANAANGSGNEGELNVTACNAQQQTCLEQARAA